MFSILEENITERADVKFNVFALMVNLLTIV